METLTLPLNEQEDYSVTITPAPKRQATYTGNKSETM